MLEFNISKSDDSVGLYKWHTQHQQPRPARVLTCQRVQHQLHKDRRHGHTHAVVCNYDTNQHSAQSPKLDCQNAADPLLALLLQALPFMALDTAAFGCFLTAGLK